MRFLNGNRASFGASRRDTFHVTFHKRGDLSTMYRVAMRRREYLLTIKHHDDSGTRARREFEVLCVRQGRLTPRPLFADLSPAHLEEPVLVTEIVPQRGAARRPVPFEDLTRIMADIHTDPRLMTLAVDHDQSCGYSLVREFHEETRPILTFRPGVLCDLLLQIRDMLEKQVDEWAPLFDPNELVYIHGNLPNNHIFYSQRGPQVIYWEFSRRSHPARELGRTCSLEQYDDQEAAALIKCYCAAAPYTVSLAAVRAQEFLEYFYACIHGVYWMDRFGYSVDQARLHRAEERLRLIQLVLRSDLKDKEAAAAKAIR